MVPEPGADSTSSRPPSASTRSCMPSRPMPRSPCRPQGVLHDEAAAVVPHLDRGVAAPHVQLHPGVPRTGVPDDVVERLLREPVEVGLDLRRDPAAPIPSRAPPAATAGPAPAPGSRSREGGRGRRGWAAASRGRYGGAAARRRPPCRAGAACARGRGARAPRRSRRARRAARPGAGRPGRAARGRSASLPARARPASRRTSGAGGRAGGPARRSWRHGPGRRRRASGRRCGALRCARPRRPGSRRRSVACQASSPESSATAGSDVEQIRVGSQLEQLLADTPTREFQVSRFRYRGRRSATEDPRPDCGFRRMASASVPGHVVI